MGKEFKMSNESSTNSQRINITLPSDLYERLKVIADIKGTGHTSLAGQVLANWVQGFEDREALKAIIRSMGDDNI